MTTHQIRALEYINNCGGNATKESFVEDHEPIGNVLWSELWWLDALHISGEGKASLTRRGEDLLKEAL